MHPHTFQDARTHARAHGGYHEIGQVGIYIYYRHTVVSSKKGNKRNRLTMVVYGIRMKESGGRVDAEEQDGNGEGEADRP